MQNIMDTSLLAPNERSEETIVRFAAVGVLLIPLWIAIRKSIPAIGTVLQLQGMGTFGMILPSFPLSTF